MNKRYIASSLLALCLGSVSAQKITTENKEIDCGRILFKSPVTAEFVVENSGDRPLFISSVRTDCGCTTVDYPTTAIPAGRKFIVKATYDAKQMGRFNKQIGIYSNGSEHPMMLSVRGVVVADITDFQGHYPHRMGDLIVDVNNIEFDNVNRGDHPVQKIHIKNIGSTVAEPVLMHLPTYLKAEISPSRVAPGHSATATVMLNSQSIRDLGLTQTSIYLGSFLGDKVSPEKEISVSTIVLPDFDHLSEARRAKAPKMRMSAGSLEMGRLEGNAKKRGTIEITNEGGSTLRINSLQMLTTGLEVSLNKTEIAPGEKARLRITAFAEGIRTARSKPRVLMITNDPENTKVVVNINTDR